MFSTNHQGFYKKHPELQKFVLNKKDKYLDPKYRIYAYYNGSNISRSSGIFAKINLDNEKDVGIFSEFSFPPWGYAFTPNDSSADNDKFMDISFFAGYDYDELVEFELPILKLPVESYFPMDFRTRGEIVEQSKKSD